MDIWEIWLEGVDWIHLAQDRNHWWIPVNMVMNLWVKKKSREFLD
jgi:hypothetical protein